MEGNQKALFEVIEKRVKTNIKYILNEIDALKRLEKNYEEQKEVLEKSVEKRKERIIELKEQFDELSSDFA